MKNSLNRFTNNGIALFVTNCTLNYVVDYTLVVITTVWHFKLWACISKGIFWLKNFERHSVLQLHKFFVVDIPSTSGLEKKNKQHWNTFENFSKFETRIRPFCTVHLTVLFDGQQRLYHHFIYHQHLGVIVENWVGLFWLFF